MSPATGDPRSSEDSARSGVSLWRLLFREWPRVGQRPRWGNLRQRLPRLRVPWSRALWGVAGALALTLTVGVTFLEQPEPDLPRNRRDAPRQPARRAPPPAPMQCQSAIGAVAFSPDGSQLAAGDEAGQIVLWDPVSRRQLRALTAHHTAVSCLAFSPDGRFLASGEGDPSRMARGDDHVILIWDVESGEIVRRLEGHTGVVASIAFSPFGGLVASAGHDRTIRIWDVTGGRLMHKFSSAAAVWSVAFSPDASILATGEQSVIRLWSTTRYREIARLTGHSDFVSRLSFTADGSRLVSASLDQTVRLWSVDDRVEIRMLQGHESAVTSLALHPDGEQLVTAGDDRKLLLWRLSGDQPPRAFATRQPWVSALSLGPGGVLATARAETVVLTPVATAR